MYTILKTPGYLKAKQGLNCVEVNFYQASCERRQFSHKIAAKELIINDMMVLSELLEFIFLVFAYF